MDFDAQEYGPAVAGILAMDGDGHRLMPLAEGTCCSAEARTRLSKARAEALFPGAQAPLAALSGLWLYFSCLDESHRLSQDIGSAAGSFWHGIMHRQEPDAGNAGYWFRRVGQHAVFPALHRAAVEITGRYPKCGFLPGAQWDPFAFIDFVETVRRRPDAEARQAALEIQRAEWQLLFDFCAKPRT